MANSIRILQIGDIHLPEWPQTLTQLDDKDVRFSEAIKRDLRGNKLRSILKKINDLATSGDIDAVVCMGDFTTRGEVNQIAKAVQIIHYLTNDTYAEKPITRLAVPGNHDVNRKEAQKFGAIGKFGKLEAALTSLGWPAPPIEDCRKYQVAGGNGSALDFHLINSALGSWSSHLLPEAIARQLQDDQINNPPISLIQEPTDQQLKTSNQAQPNYTTREEQAYDQLDTPYISMKSLDTLKSMLEESEKDCAILVAHHNLLTQPTPRIAPYSELLNAGQIRKFLQNTGRNIIYLHGHIHSDPVEKISEVQAHSNTSQETQIITVSAPALWDGFNELCFFLDETNEVFLMRVTQYRPDEFGTVGNYSDQISRYVPIRNRTQQLLTKAVQRTWGLIRDQRVLSWHDALRLATSNSISEDELHHAILSLFCCGLVQVGHLGRDKARWRITVSEAA
jgi:hypothetical protein